jgi:hypothetical protein
LQHRRSQQIAGFNTLVLQFGKRHGPTVGMHAPTHYLFQFPRYFLQTQPL